MKSRYVSCVALATCTLSAFGQVIPIGNPGFESPAITNCNFRGFVAATDVWAIDLGGNVGMWRPSTCWDLSAPQGAQVAYSNGGIGMQTLSTKALASTVYTLSAFIGTRNHPCCNPTGASLELWAGPTKIGSLDLNASQVPPRGTWQRKTLVVTSPVGLTPNQNLIIRFKSLGTQQDFDDFSLVMGDSSCPADINGDGQVDDSDFVLFVAAYNILLCTDPAMPAGCPSDLNGDGFVDDEDFTAFVVGYNALLCP